MAQLVTGPDLYHRAYTPNAVVELLPHTVETNIFVKTTACAVYIASYQIHVNTLLMVVNWGRKPEYPEKTPVVK